LEHTEVSKSTEATGEEALERGDGDRDAQEREKSGAGQGTCERYEALSVHRACTSSSPIHHHELELQWNEATERLIAVGRPGDAAPRSPAPSGVIDQPVHLPPTERCQHPRTVDRPQLAPRRSEGRCAPNQQHQTLTCGRLRSVTASGTRSMLWWSSSSGGTNPRRDPGVVFCRAAPSSA
jgi:hypothetical protein